ncbi:AAA family ATPase [Lujinxingia vulgaris]|uniref:AAA family ATPase n=1 Tax=Lujinxingia vulgaris TaxID=2600176 RepID=A0A5C6XRT8_9DELT|nr:AAA family ATPase [Lujinxingia vulgaris]TXD41672.1 AAA family ATPase [Lujinxingia vulgaris]
MRDGLQNIHITGFGSLADVQLQPGRLTVLIGANGSGKSNILRALRMIPLIRTGSLQRFVAEAGGASALLHYGPKHTPVITIKLEFSQNERCNTYEARLGFAAGDKLMFLDEQVGYQPTPDAEVHLTSLGAGHWESELRGAKDADTTARTVNHWLSQLTFFHVHDTSMTSALRTNARAEDDRYLRSDGSNLAAYLFRLQQSEDDADRKAWRRINRFVSRIVPAVKELAPTQVNATTLRLDWIDDQDERFGAHQLSDGTLRAIALITALAQPTAHLPKFISIDEPELGLHPAAIRTLAELARSVSRHTQILFATQSTAFLDHFDPAEVVVVERQNGASTLHRLDEAQLALWLEDYSLSEIFDKGVIGGRP